MIANKIILSNPCLKIDRKPCKIALNSMNSDQALLPLLEIASFAIHGLHEIRKDSSVLQIIVDPKNEGVTPLTLGKVKGAYEVYYNGEDKIYLGGNRSSKDLEKSRHLARGTFIHEITHFVANEVFKNLCKPYFLGDVETMKKFTGICDTIYEKVKNKKELHLIYYF